ncbi:UDP-3-O-[3-hydroxymyristoyl] glucosamine N-acyltransferase [Hypnocyclicus thermotrophus]|uniref:UDP-3-O-acylglucosamine N-acyltransferase n=1 Tax=Hypnocyclicus thermotrophus TaxID=1627895 RepID=A0AA46DZE8_9FUSO|nr:UDP-3-O-(3-hydroxymyristoyl)glucosamine N-acyltransferase [Hypnocyclicus thermotrophus]TDT71797.1 UDP-3-O-[3-hydroxymyristoyl] glucosamine N-acyltransferase [Hypnocyclicus thermotrophus]
MYSIKRLSEMINGEIYGESDITVKRIAPFESATNRELTFAADKKYLSKLDETRAKVIIIPNINKDILPKDKTYIIVNDSPRILMPKILDFFKPKIKDIKEMIEKDAKISNSAKIAPNTYIGHNVEIGENTIIYPNVTILEGVKIGKNCIIYPNVTIREFCEIGNDVILQPGCVIGSDGFGYVKVDNKNTKIDQIGRVIIEDRVEIGANSTIDRGAIGDTRIKEGTKLDNLVHIAHNVEIGKESIIIAQVGIAGSTEIGDNVTLAGQVGVVGHIKIGNNVVAAAKSAITGSIKDNSKISGYPAIDYAEDLKAKVAFKRLPELLKRVRVLEKLINK